MKEKNITRVSLDELRGTKGLTRANAPEGPEAGPEFWRKARVVERQPKKSIHLRIDADVFDYFKAQGDGHLTRMNAVLRSYVEAKKAE